jgi:hypothetical protein
MRLPVAVLALVIASLELLGCAAIWKDRLVHEMAGQHVYRNKSLDDVLPVAQVLLSERGFSVRQDGQVGALVTEWEEGVGGAARLPGTFTRYLAAGRELPDGCEVRVFRLTLFSRAGRVAPADVTSVEKMVRSGFSGDAIRDLDLEWELIKRVEPEEAAEIEARAGQEVDRNAR